MKDITITDSIRYIGADDRTLDLFESQYHIPNGVSYNSYVILDEKRLLWTRWMPERRRNG